MSFGRGASLLLSMFNDPKNDLKCPNNRESILCCSRNLTKINEMICNAYQTLNLNNVDRTAFIPREAWYVRGHLEFLCSLQKS